MKILAQLTGGASMPPGGAPTQSMMGMSDNMMGSQVPGGMGPGMAGMTGMPGQMGDTLNQRQGPAMM